MTLKSRYWVGLLTNWALRHCVEVIYDIVHIMDRVLRVGYSAYVANGVCLAWCLTMVSVHGVGHGEGHEHVDGRCLGRAITFMAWVRAVASLDLAYTLGAASLIAYGA